MLKKKEYIVVGLTTFHTEFLRISVPQLARLDKNIYLIIHNDNPDLHITTSCIRKFGYRGPLHIINNKNNVGPLAARLNITSAIQDLKIKSTWMIFVDDDDILVDIDVPPVMDTTFAVMQNIAFVKRRLIDLLRIIDNPKNYTVDDYHITLERPHIGIVGNLLRTDLMISVGKLTRELLPQIYEIDNSLGTRAPEDIVMWFYLQIYAKHLNPGAEPIYMDKTNYIATALDSSDKKYGKDLIPDDQPAEYYNNTMQRYCDLLTNLLAANAAPAGH